MKPQDTEPVLLCGQMDQSLIMVTVGPLYAGETKDWTDGNKKMCFSEKIRRSLMQSYGRFGRLRYCHTRNINCQ